MRLRQFLRFFREKKFAQIISSLHSNFKVVSVNEFVGERREVLPLGKLEKRNSREAKEV